MNRSRIPVMSMRLRWSFRLMLGLLLMAWQACAPANSAQEGDFNARVLAAVKSMPTGGGYDGSDATKNLLPKACKVVAGQLRVDAGVARPSFCSGATYLVLLEALDTGSEALLPVRDHKDGHGVFGRWNANGPGAAKLVADLGAGVNFTSWQKARPGDFMKIWWTEAIGGRERGHLVVYLGHDARELRFWSSNLPGGYGVKSVPIEDCRRVLFTRITRPQAFSRASTLPARDPWLERMLKDDFAWNEVAEKCQVQEAAQGQ